MDKILHIGCKFVVLPWSLKTNYKLILIKKLLRVLVKRLSFNFHIRFIIHYCLIKNKKIEQVIIETSHKT